MIKNNPAISNGKPQYYKRDLQVEIMKYLFSREVLVIKGPRQSGKTTLMQYVYKSLPADAKADFITFEDRDILEIFDSDLVNFSKLYVADNDFLFIDEFQYAKEGGQKLKQLYDSQKCKFVISGSSSLELTGKLGKYMVGRMLSFELLPFSFSEVLGTVNQNLHKLVFDVKTQVYQSISRDHILPDDPINSSSIINQLRNVLQDYLIWGGYPAVLNAKDDVERRFVLSNLVENYLAKDIRDLLKLESERQLVELARFLSLLISNMVVYDRLSKDTKLPFESLKTHIKILQETYVIELIYPFFTNRRVELVKSPMVYFYDIGFRNSLIDMFSKLDLRNDKGSVLENYVFSALRRELVNKGEIKFWRTKSQAEVDFVFRKFDGEVIPIEVKYGANDSTNIGKSLYSFIERYSPKKCFVITIDFWGSKVVHGTDIRFIPAFYL